MSCKLDRALYISFAFYLGHWRRKIIFKLSRLLHLDDSGFGRN